MTNSKSAAGTVASGRSPRVVRTADPADATPVISDTPTNGAAPSSVVPATGWPESQSATEQAATEEDRMSRADAPAPKARARHAHLFVTHLDPWSVMKNAFMLAIAVAIVMVVAVTVLWAMLSLSGTLDALTRTLTDIAGGGTNAIDTASLFSFSRIVGVTALLAALEVVLLTALATLFAFLYNLAVGITGGLQVTLTDDS